MRIYLITLITVFTLIVIAAAAVVVYADQSQASISPDQILKGTTPTVTIMLDKSIPSWQDITSVSVGGQVVTVSKPSTEGKLSVLLPKLDIVGRADVEVIGKDNKLVSVGQLEYVVSADRPYKGLCLLLIYVFLIVLPPSIYTFYDIRRSYEERAKVLGNLRQNATHDEIKALLVDMDQGPTGLVGLTRGIVAVTLIFILAIAVFHLVVFAPSSVPHIAEQLLTGLAATLTAITGFYFGSKATAESTQSNKFSSTMSASSVVPKISSVNQVLATNILQVNGEGFGTQQGKGAVKVKDKNSGTIIMVTDIKWEDKKIEVTVPSGLKPGMFDVNIVVTNDSEKSSDPYPFKI
jgi:hypothetical protein